MTETHYRQDVTGATAAPIHHESHGRHVRTTWFVKVSFTDGTEIRCPHTTEGHRTKGAAAACARRMVTALPIAPEAK